jgi:hypothetical protein
VKKLSSRWPPAWTNASVYCSTSFWKRAESEPPLDEPDESDELFEESDEPLELCENEQAREPAQAIASATANARRADWGIMSQI